MNDAAFIGIHGFQRGGTTAAEHAPCDLFCQLFQCLATLFPIAVAVQQQAAVILAVLIHQNRCQILNGIQCFASSADDRAAFIIAAKFHANAVCGTHGADGHGDAHSSVNVCDILSCTEQVRGHFALGQNGFDRFGLHAPCGRIVVLVNNDLLHGRNRFLYRSGNRHCRCGFCLRLRGFRLFRSLGFCGFCWCSFFCCFVHCFYLCFPLYLSENSFFRFFQNAEHDLVFRNAELFDRQMLCFFDAFCSENLFHSHSSLSLVMGFHRAVPCEL